MKKRINKEKRGKEKNRGALQEQVRTAKQIIKYLKKDEKRGNKARERKKESARVSEEQNRENVIMGLPDF